VIYDSGLDFNTGGLDSIVRKRIDQLLPVFVLYNFIAGLCGTLVSAIALEGLAFVAPTSAGQSYVVSKFVPPRWSIKASRLTS